MIALNFRHMGFPGGSDGGLHCGRPRFDPWIVKIQEKGMATPSSILVWRIPGNQWLTTSCCLVWGQSFSLYHQPSGRESDFHMETFLSESPCRWVQEPKRSYRERSERMKSKNVSWKSPENQLSLAKSPETTIVVCLLS